MNSVAINKQLKNNETFYYFIFLYILYYSVVKLNSLFFEEHLVYNNLKTVCN